MTNKEFATGLRAIADFYETSPELPQFCPWGFVWSETDFLGALKCLVAGGKVAKKVDDNNYSISRLFAGVKLTIQTPRELVCKRVVTWKCPDSLLAKMMADAEEKDA